MKIEKFNEKNYRCDEKDYLLVITEHGHMKDSVNFWLRIKPGHEITDGFISKKELRKLRDNLTEIINKIR